RAAPTSRSAISATTSIKEHRTMRIHALPFALSLIFSSAAGAATPKMVSLQGVVRTAQGALQTSSSMVTVKLFDAQTAGNALGSFGPTAVMVQNGLFTLAIPVSSGEITAIGGAAQLWMEVTVDSETYS